MSDCRLECVSCRSRFELSAMTAGCPHCRARGVAAPVEVRYDWTGSDWPAKSCLGIWRWRSFLPPFPEASLTSLGESATPLLKIGGEAGSLYLKNETMNPTWSWKDRPNSISISAARHFGFSRVAASSTVNHGCAVAAYAARAGLASVIFCHPQAPALQVAVMEGYGAKVIRGEGQEDALRRLVESGEYFPATILCPRAGYSNPFGIEGFKAIAFELKEQLGTTPDRVFVPVGGGDGIYGIWKGFRELREMGRTAAAPKMVACQAAGADSLYRAFRKRATRNESLNSVSTIALSVAEPVTGDHALRAVYESGGSVMIASDEDILRAARSLMRKGLALEFASALAFACAERAMADGTCSEFPVVIGSGAAVKWPDAFLKNIPIS